MARRRDEPPPGKGRRPRRPRRLTETLGTAPLPPRGFAGAQLPRDVLYRREIQAQGLPPGYAQAGATLGAPTPTPERRLEEIRRRMGAAARQAIPTRQEFFEPVTRAQEAIPTRQEFFEPVTRAQEAIPTRADLEWLRRLMDIMGLGPIKRTLTGEEPFPWRR